MTGGLIIQTETDEFTVSGTGIVITCMSDKPEAPNAGILQLDEGTSTGNGNRLDG